MQRLNRLLISSVCFALCAFLVGVKLGYAQSTAPSALLLFPSAPVAFASPSSDGNAAAAYQDLLIRLAEQAQSLKQQGLLQAYTLQADIGALRIVGATPDAITLLQRATPVTLIAQPDTPATRSQARQHVQTGRRTMPRLRSQALAVAAVGAAQSHNVTAPLVRTGIFLDQNEVQIYGTATNTAVTIRLFDSNNTLKAETTITTNGDGFAVAQLSAIARSGDRVTVQASGQALVQTTLPRLVIELDKAADSFHGEAPAQQSLFFFVQSWRTNDWRSFDATLTANNQGRYQLAIGAQWDLRMGDVGAVVASDQSFDIYRSFTVPGYWVNLTENSVGGTGLPVGATVKATLYDRAGKLLAEGEDQVNSYGDLAIWEFAGCEREGGNLQAGHVIVLQTAGQAAVTVSVPSITLVMVATNDTLTGSAPARAKLSSLVWLAASTTVATDIDTLRADGNGNFSASFAGRFNIQAGDWGEVRYFDAQDNQIHVTIRAPGLLSANLTDDTLDLSGNPNQAATITLRNALGAVKTLTTATFDEMGSGYVSFYDTVGNLLDLVAGDTVQITGAGLNDTYTTTPLTALANRTTRTVTGRAQPQTAVLVEVGYGAAGKIVTTDASGAYAVTFAAMVGGDRVRVTQPTGAGRETVVQIYAPRIRVSLWSTTETAVYGYAAPQQLVAVEVLAQATQQVKARGVTQTDQNGWYNLDLAVALQPQDRVTAQSGALQLQFTTTALNFQVNSTTNLLTGQTAPQANLLLTMWRSIDGFYSYNSQEITTDGNGNFATDFGGMDFWPGDEFTVYYQNAAQDQQRLIKVLPNLEVDQTRNEIYSRGEPGLPVKLTLRNAQGTLLSTTIFTPTSIYQRISSFFNPDTDAQQDLVAGQTIMWENNGQQIVTTIPTLNATLDTTADRVQGTGPANSTLYAAAFHWRDRWYSTAGEQANIAQQVTANDAGAFTADLHCKADLQTGDYAVVHYADAQKNYHRADGFTTQPVLTPLLVPTTVRAGEAVRVEWEITEAAHVEYTYVGWYQPTTKAYGVTADLRGGAGHYQAEFAAPNRGPLSLYIYAAVDGQDRRAVSRVAITDTIPLAVQDPVNGTTNLAQPVIQGMAAPSATLALYDGQTLLVEGVAGADGSFTLQPPNALANGAHNFWVRATVAPTLTVESPHLQVNLDTALAIDPMHIYITNRNQRQRLHDEQGFANLGGRIWTRSGDTIAIEVPIRCSDVRTADLLVGGVYATSLVRADADLWAGVYTPPSSGNYAIALQLNCAGVEQRITLLNGLIDPDGYVYWADSGPDLRLAGATVSCYQLVENAWRLWPGYLYGQQNPQTTAADGYYAFFTEPGQYQLRVEAPGFTLYESPTITVTDEPVHHNAPLVAKAKLYLPLVRR